jgi:hypothetical protein
MANVSSNHKTLRKRRPPDGRKHGKKEHSQVDVASANLHAPVIPRGVLDEIENQRDVLVTVITLLHCLHVVLDRREGDLEEELNPSIKAAAGWASLPEMTTILLNRTHAVLDALDSVNLIEASKAFKP